MSENWKYCLLAPITWDTPQNQITKFKWQTYRILMLARKEEIEWEIEYLRKKFEWIRMWIVTMPSREIINIQQ